MAARCWVPRRGPSPWPRPPHRATATTITAIRRRRRPPRQLGPSKRRRIHRWDRTRRKSNRKRQKGQRDGAARRRPTGPSEPCSVCPSRTPCARCASRWSSGSILLFYINYFVILENVFFFFTQIIKFLRRLKIETIYIILNRDSVNLLLFNN